ncbi:hypothetical protein QBZ16_002490 [Prototheca wickerhamii]|uniref:Nascent polypeptide-associated complex subunit alpha-like UBA domain-containing protein n=1 Tax=Prototheca wickerhamii TaxID=3111 RepID=A0AAD9IMQ6_PROWI|nr:hypothetical protein QBZ16_002490 [Prototheca wickerhamii]
MADVGGPSGSSSREGNEQAKALDKMTDQVEEREMKKVDQSKVQAAMAELAQQEREKQEATRQRERELAAVKVESGDVELIAAEFEIEKKAAERHLREAGGDVKAALRSLAMQA